MNNASAQVDADEERDVCAHSSPGHLSISDRQAAASPAHSIV